ncbi:MAG: CAAX prenyl protease-related protein [Verrucomicrobiota bacterium]
MASHVAPFAAWMALMYLPWPPGAWNYAVRSLACLGLLACLRPWRWYSRLQVRNLLPALLVGAGVCAIWVLPESAWAARWPAWKAFYAKWIMFSRAAGEPLKATPYAPDVCGWPLAIVRLAGSALVIAPIEEFFWRGFVYRWLQERKPFWQIDLGRMNAGLFLAVALAFGVEHGSRWLVGFAAGIAYGWLAVRTRDLWAACAAHAVTNFLLGLYVLATGSYGFW